MYAVIINPLKLFYIIFSQTDLFFNPVIFLPNPSAPNSITKLGLNGIHTDLTVFVKQVLKTTLSQLFKWHKIL